MSFITEGRKVTFQTVDPQYQSWLHLVGMLDALNVITLSSKQHSFPLSLGLTPYPMPKVPGHWIQMAIVSLSLEYIELIADKRRKCVT